MAAKKATATTRNEKVLALVGDYQSRIAEARASKLLTPSATTVMETAGHKVVLVDMTSLTIGQLPIQALDGYSVHIAKAGSDQVAAMLDLGNAGIFGPIYPGLTIRPKQRFRSGNIRRWRSSTKPIAGNLTQAGCDSIGNYLTLIVGKTPEAEYEDNGAAQPGGFNHVRQVLQAYNSLLNVPTGNLDGINARGARAIRTIVGAGGGTILGGTIVWWYQGPEGSGGNWSETEFQQPIVTGRSTWASTEFETPFSCGRYFPELRSYTSSNAQAPEMAVYSVGEGGELNVGDVAP